MAFERGYNIIYLNSDEDPEKERKVFRTLEQKMVDGVIFIPSVYSTKNQQIIKDFSVPIVAVDRVFDVDGIKGGVIVHKVTVVGSMNYDTTIHVKKFPLPGETILAEAYSNSLGGKGANQAAALAKVGLEVSMIGAVGQDNEGHAMLNELNHLGINTDNVHLSDEQPTGRAQIVVEESGNNNIIVIPGANGRFSEEHIDRCQQAISSADAILAQLEIPLMTVQYVFALAKRMNKLTVLNPAPVCSLKEELLQNVDILIPNEIEMEKLYGKPLKSYGELETACEYFTGLGVKIVIVTLGERGCYYYHQGQGKFAACYAVKAIDTTAAGDSFIGGFLGNYLETKDIDQAIDFGQRVAAITVSRRGAIESIPNRIEALTTSLSK
ncbi:MAG TPA: ribokinase [Mobilitalea sp.]|nr:ribokinase [Mobilitalea sp.]